MENVLDLLQEMSKKYQSELDEINKKIIPLKKKKNELESKISKYNDLISLETGENISAVEHSCDATETISARQLDIHADNYRKTTPIEAYKRIIIENFSDKHFRESDIRAVACGEGITTREGSEISPSYSRAIFVQLKKNNFVNQIERGVYRYQKQQSLV